MAGEKEEENRWMDEKQMDGWMDINNGWMDRKTQMDGWIEKNRWMGGRKDTKQMDGWTDIN